MQVMVNGSPRDVAGPTLDDLLRECGISGRVATAVNETFVPATARGAHRLSEGDRIEVLGAMQGG